MLPDHGTFNWVRFLVRFFFGAVLGSVAGLYPAGMADKFAGILMITGMALLMGLIAGFWGDRFWEAFRDGGFWNPFRWF